MIKLSTIALQVYHLQAMVDFYREAFGFQFQPVTTGGFPSQFGTMGELTLKLVPLRAAADFEGYPSHQLGFAVPDVEHVIALADKHGGCQEGGIVYNERSIHAAVRDPDGNTIELYTDLEAENSTS